MYIVSLTVCSGADQIAQNADLKPLVNSYVQQLVQIKWELSTTEISIETNTSATKAIPALNQSWGGCNHPTSYQAHQIPYIVPGTVDYLSPLWSNTEHWPYAPGLCSVTGKSWRILHSWLIEYSLRGNSWDLHNGIPVRSDILLSDMNGQIFWSIPHWNHPRTDANFELQLVPRPRQYNRAWSICSEIETSYEGHLHV